MDQFVADNSVEWTLTSAAPAPTSNTSSADQRPVKLQKQDIEKELARVLRWYYCPDDYSDQLAWHPWYHDVWYFLFQGEWRYQEKRASDWLARRQYWQGQYQYTLIYILQSTSLLVNLGKCVSITSFFQSEVQTPEMIRLLTTVVAESVIDGIGG